MEDSVKRYEDTGSSILESFAANTGSLSDAASQIPAFDQGC